MIAAIYARKSTEQSGVADEQKSVARQIEHARAYAVRKGWTVLDEHVYVDDGISGAEFANRPGFIRLMNTLKPRAAFGVLIMSEESRLGREQIEVSYALKQIVTAGVRVFSYLTDSERTLDSAIDKAMLALQSMADEMEREKARQRTYDAMQRKAKAGHVTGGSCFGYRNVDVPGPDGRRAYVRREVEPAEAEVIRQIFRLCAEGPGMKMIAKLLNDQRAPSPRAQLGRSQTWTPTSVRSVLYRHTYRGEIRWNQSRKRDRWGQHRQKARPESEWLHVPAPALRIVSDAEWQAAHNRLEQSRAVYLRGTKGQRFGRPTLGNPSPYLLTNLSECGCCHDGLWVRSRNHGPDGQRERFYGCSAYHQRGRSVCTNNRDIPMVDADSIVLDALLDDVLDTSMIAEAIDQAFDLLMQTPKDNRAALLDEELSRVESERARLVSAIAAGGELAGLLEALREREAAKMRIESDRAAIARQAPPRATDGVTVRKQLIALANDWRQVLADDPGNARPIVSKLLAGRVIFTPLEEPRRWRVTGRSTLTGLFGNVVFPGMGSSPPGFEPGSWP